ncbi:MAG: thioredoxin family protein [Bdellovibrionia bacterium]
MKTLIFILISFNSLSYTIAAPRGDATVAIEFSGPTLKASVKEGFHFNDKAPNSVTIDSVIYKPTALKGRQSEFTGLPNEWLKGIASLYVCDDAVTFCEPHLIDLKSSAATSKIVASAPAVSKNKGRVNAHGFIEDDLQKAIDKAKKDNKLVLIDFSARWCPGCIRLEKEVFDTKEFKGATGRFVKVKIDVDRFENQILSEKFNVKAIPTLLVLNSEQQEIDRLIDYQPKEVWKPFFAEIAADPTSLAKLFEMEKTPEVLKRLGHRLVMAGRFQESGKYLAQVKPVPAELAYANIEAAKAEAKADVGKETDLIKVLKDSIAAEPESSRSITWRTDLVEHVPEIAEKKKIKDEGLQLADALVADPKKMKTATETDLIGEFAGYESLLIASNAADLAAAAGADEAEMKTVWNKAVEAGRKLNISPKNSGPALRYLIVLTAAKNYPEAEKLSSAILKADPKNADVQRRRVKVLNALGLYGEAVALGEKAVKNSYGRNEFWVAENLAKAYVGAGQKAKAVELINSYLSRPEADWANLKSTKTSLQDLRASLDSAK